MPKTKERALEPEGLWISTEGKSIAVVEHLVAIKQYPELFDVPQRDVEGATIKDLRDLAVGLIRSGWVRFRFFGGTWSFEVDKASRRLAVIERILAKQGAYTEDRVLISQLAPRRDFVGTVAEFYDRAMFRQYELGRRNRWRLS